MLKNNEETSGCELALLLLEFYKKSNNPASKEAIGTFELTFFSQRLFLSNFLYLRVFDLFYIFVFLVGVSLLVLVSQP